MKRLGVQQLFLFGSTARADARTESDADLFLDNEVGKRSLFGVLEIEEQASRILGCHADIMTRDSLHRLVRAHVEASPSPIFR